MAEPIATIHPPPHPAGPVPAPNRRGSSIERVAPPVHQTTPVPPGGRDYTVALLVLGGLAVLGISALISLLVGGPAPYAKWGYAAAALVFMLSTFQAAPPLALASRLTTGYWGIPLRRAADLGAIGGLVSAPLCLVLLFALPDFTGRASIWLDWPGGPRVWDGIAITLLALLGVVLVYVNALPELAARPRPPWLARQWRGTTRQWAVLSRALAILGSLYLLLLVFVHLVVASDLAVSLVPGWKSADMPPYQIASCSSGRSGHGRPRGSAREPAGRWPTAYRPRHVPCLQQATADADAVLVLLHLGRNSD